MLRPFWDTLRAEQNKLQVESGRLDTQNAVLLALIERYQDLLVYPWA